MTDAREYAEALKEIGGRILQVSNRALAKMVEQEGPLGEAAAAELERREALGKVREMDDLELDTAARGDAPLAAMANAEVVRRRQARAQERAETETAAMVEAVIELDARIAELVLERADRFRQALEARYGTGLPLHDGRATNAIATALVEDLAGGHPIDRSLATSLGQTLNGICRRYAEDQRTEE